jgi:hypothetical protein
MYIKKITCPRAGTHEIFTCPTGKTTSPGRRAVGFVSRCNCPFIYSLKYNRKIISLISNCFIIYDSLNFISLSVWVKSTLPEMEGGRDVRPPILKIKWL